MHAHRSQLFRFGLAALLSLASCSGSSGGGSSVSANSNPVHKYVVRESIPVFAAIARLRLLVPVLLVPGMQAAAGITFELDTSVGAAPHTYDYVIPLDSDGNGSQETTIAGEVVLSADPFAGGVLAAGFHAATDVTVTTNGGMGVFEGMLELSFGAGGGFRVSGTGTYADAATSSSVSVAVEPADALHIRTASAAPDRMPNACVYCVDGKVSVDASSADGDYSADWQFSTTSKLIQVLNASFKPTGGKQKPLSNSQFEAGPCPGSGAIGDWAGNYTFDWFCIPPESGQSSITITVVNSKTIEIVDEEPPASGNILVYRAKRDAHDPHVVHGSFVDGDYEEDFTWILSPDGQSFQQVSEYFYFQGPMAGSGGDCGGVAARN